MVVLKPILEGERIRRCPCGHIGLCSPIAERSSFYPSNTRGYRAYCKPCSRRLSEEWKRDNRERDNRRRNARRAERLLDPVNRAEAQRKARARWQRIKHDPVEKEKRKLACKRYREKHREELRERDRIDSRLKREQEGKWKVPKVDELRKVSRRKRLLPNGPLLRWVNELLEKEIATLLFQGLDLKAAQAEANGNVARFLDIDERRLYGIQKEQQFVEALTVDRMVTAHGGITIDELYHNYGDGYMIYVADDFTYLRVELASPHPDPDTINPLDKHFWCGERELV